MKLSFWNTASAEPTRPSDASSIQAKLIACAAEIREAEAELRRVSLSAALGEDQTTAYEALNRLNALKAKQELLSAALSAAQQAEHKAAQAGREREFAARRRAASQHASRLEREARAVSEIETELLKHFEAMNDAASSLVATLPDRMRSREEPWQELIGTDALREAVLLEGHRMNRERRAALFQRPTGTLGYEDWETGRLPALTDRIAQMTKTIREHFDLAAPHKPQTTTPETANPVLSAPVSLDAPPLPSSDAEPRVDELIDLRKGQASEASVGEEEVMNG